MTDKEKLRQLFEEEQKGKKHYRRSLTLITLSDKVNQETGMLPKELYLLGYDVDKAFLDEVFEKLGYGFEYKEEYNSYFEQYCYKVKLSEK